MTKILKQRKAIAMIELIFAIIVMAIALMSTPMMISTAVKSSIVSFQQESIAITATHANALMSYAWDENNTESQGGAYRNAILTTQSTSDALTDRNASKTPGRERVLPTTNINASATTLFGPAKDKNLNGLIEGTDEKDDIDDFDGTEMHLVLIENADTINGNYMDRNITLSTNIVYGGDDINYLACQTGTSGCAFSQPFTLATAGTSNIKRITVSFASATTDTAINLKLFMCNIGGATPDTQGGY